MNSISKKEEYIKSYKGILKKYEESNDIKDYFKELPKLLQISSEKEIDGNKLPLEIALAYMFLKIEQGQFRILYGSVAKKYKADIDIVKNILKKMHLTREGFRKIYGNIHREQPNSNLNKALTIRDQVIHGKIVGDSELREAIYDCLEYANSVNQDVYRLVGFKPFGDMRGFVSTGRKSQNQKNNDVNYLNKETTRFLLKGLGFPLN